MATQTQSIAAHSEIEMVHDSSYIPRGSVTAQLHFFQPPEDGSKPFNYVESPPEGQPQTNFDLKGIPVNIQDIRGQESSFTMDKNAFETLTTGPSAEKDFASEESIKKNYYPEVEELLLKQTGAKRIVLFDHTIRRATGDRGPVNRVHIDQTTASATARIHHHLPNEADELLKDRVRLINVWRPINGTVQSSPLAFADSSTVNDDALVGIEHRYPDRTGETAAVKHANEQWHYWSGMDNNERLFLQCYDSKLGARVPHTAFVDPRTPQGAKQRESIEVRALVFG